MEFSNALRQAESIASFDERSRRRIKEAVAVSYIHLGEGARAEPILREIISADSTALGPDHPPVLRERTYLAQALMTQGNYKAAVREADAVYPLLVSRLGPEHEIVMTLLGTRAASEGSLGLWDAAIRDDLAMRDVSLRKRGSASFFAIASLSDAALSQCRAGRFLDGETSARKAFNEAVHAFGPRSGASGGCAYALSVCLVGSNRLTEASELLRGIDVDTVSQMSGDPTVGPSIKLVQAEIAVRRGDFGLARQLLDTAAPTFNGPNAGSGEKQAIARVRKLIELQPVASQVKRVPAERHQ
jgi:hypothetical protein